MTLLDDLLTPNLPAWPDVFGRALRQCLADQGYRRIRTLSLFSGGGGLDIAFQDAGFEIFDMVERDAACIATLTRNAQCGCLLQGANPMHCDIKDYEPDLIDEIDFVIGGPPCQPFSAAGRRMNGVSGTSAEEGNLFKYYVSVIMDLTPRGFLLENVTGLLSAQGGNAWREMQEAFQSCGYKIFTRVLDSADYGVPQHRERVFVVGLLEGEFLFPKATHGEHSGSNRMLYHAAMAVRDLQSDNDAVLMNKGKYSHLLADIPPGLNYSFYTQKMGHPHPVFSWRSKFSDFLYKADPELPTRTIKANGGQYTGPFHWDGRHFDINELKRLQTIPDNYELPVGRTIGLRQIGNAVPPQIGRILALAIREQVYGEAIPLSLEYIDDEGALRFNKRKNLRREHYLEKAGAIHQIAADINGSSSSPETDSKSLGTKVIVPIEHLRLVRHVTRNFGWEEIAVGESKLLHVLCVISADAWRIRVGQKGRVRKRSVYTITLTPPDNGEWGIGAKVVKISATDGSAATFTACWKVFEEMIRRFHCLADLVQLSGYYYYDSQIKIQIKPKKRAAITAQFRVVKEVSLGSGVASIFSLDDLAKKWQVEREMIPLHVYCLRKLGYEVRSNNTNAQIPPMHYLIPYPFPTLTPESVQVHKKIHADELEDMESLLTLAGMLITPDEFMSI